jgi:mRNA interferase HigB
LSTEPFLREATKAFPQAASWIGAFVEIARAAKWKNHMDVRKQYPHADAVVVESKRTVVIFNVAGNTYRLISAIHFNTQIVFTLQFLTHAEYSKNTWKNEL